jgi:hypothetical protein
VTLVELVRPCQWKKREDAKMMAVYYKYELFNKNLEVQVEVQVEVDVLLLSLLVL